MDAGQSQSKLQILQSPLGNVRALWGQYAPHCSFTGMNLSNQLRIFSRDSSDSLYMAARTSEKAQRSSSPRLRSSNVKQ